MKQALFDIRSEEVQEILGQIPGKITRWGITCLLIFILLIIAGCWFFKYPDIISAAITITGQHPPATIVAKSTGKLEKLFITEQQMVDSGQALALIENDAVYEDIVKLRNTIDSIIKYHMTDDTSSFLQSDPNLKLGDVQSSYLNFIKSYTEYLQFFELDYYLKKNRSLQKEINKNQAYRERLNGQKRILSSDQDIFVEKFKRDSDLYVKGLISLSQLEDSRSLLMKKKISLEEVLTSLADNQVHISQIEQEILDNQLNRQQKKNELTRNLHNSFEEICNQLNSWEHKYLLKSPVYGKVSLTKVWSPNQNITTGNKVMTILPSDSGRLIGKVDLRLRGAGKVRKGQPVNIKLDNFPSSEFGIIKGKISSISLIAEDSCYSVEVALPDNLTTNFGRKLPHSQKLQGKAEIITEDVNLLERIFNPLRVVIREHTNN